MQYTTPFTCPDCGEHTFETDAAISSERDLAQSTCTNCGHVFEDSEIAVQAKNLPHAAIRKMIADAEALNRKYAGR